MAIIPQGITGPFIGKVGPVVGYVSRGKAIMRGRPEYKQVTQALPASASTACEILPDE